MKKKPGLALLCLWLVAPLVVAQNASPPAPAAAPASSPAPAAPTAGPSSLEQAKAAQQSAPVSLLNADLFYELLVGEITAQEGDPAAGFSLMLDAARKSGDAQLYQRATDIALQARSGDAALQAARAWKQALPASRDANRYQLQILIALNRISDTQEPLKTELRMAPDAERIALLNAVPRAYARASDKTLAATVVENALAAYLAPNATGNVAGTAWTTVARMRWAAGDNAGALQAAQKGQAADPRAEGPVVVALELMDAKRPEAEAMVQAYLRHPEASARLPEVRMAYARALLDAQRYVEATAQLQTVTRERPDYPESWLVLGTLQLQDNQLDAAQASLERYLAVAQSALAAQTAQAAQSDEESQTDPAAQTQTSAGLTQAYLALAELAEKRKDYAAAESWLNKIDNVAELVRAQSRRASILASQGKLEEGRRLLGQLPERTPEEARAKLNAQVSLLREFKQYRQAHALVAKALTKEPQDTDLLYEQSMLAEKLGSPDEMERLLRQIIALKPDFHPAYNALGYSLADRNIRLSEARELIRKAVAYAPADPFIQDSLGWVEFRMGNLPEATKILEAAYKAKPDAEIAAHLGEVLWSMGQRERALAMWKEGQLLNPDNETLLETLKRLKVKP
ncbi:MAG: tetratricopeptide repeat protein [Polaromonas sp.]